MTRKEATDLYVKSNTASNNIISKILLWEETQSIPYNASKLKITTEDAYRFKAKYNLKFTKVRPINKKQVKVENTLSKLLGDGVTAADLINCLLKINSGKVNTPTEVFTPTSTVDTSLGMVNSNNSL